MFESRIANVIAYGGLALVILVPLADFALGFMDAKPVPVVAEAPVIAAPVTVPVKPIEPKPVSAAPAPVPVAPSVLPPTPTVAPAVPVRPEPPAVPVVKPAVVLPAEEIEQIVPPPGEVLRPGTRIKMTPEQIRGPVVETEPAAGTAVTEPETVAAPVKVAPIPRPRSERPEPPAVVVVRTPRPRQPAPRAEPPLIILGSPERPLGTMPIQGFPNQGPVPPANIPYGNTVEQLRGWDDGNLEDYLARQRDGRGSPDDRFVPPANVGY